MGVHTVAVSYIPNPDPEALIWMQNFLHQIQPRPEAFGVDARDADSLAGQVGDFSGKLQIATNPTTRTNPNITEKVIARNAAVATIQRLVRVIKVHPLIENADLISLGLPLPQERRKEIPAPQSAPMLWVVASGDGVHHMRYADSLNPESRRKPPDVMHMQLYLSVGRELATDPVGGKAAFHGLITRNPFEVRHDPKDNGLTATYFGRWSTRTGLTGPWSLPVAMTVTFVQRGGGT